MKRLYRSCEDRIIAGVAGGIAEYFEVDSTLIRLIMLLIIFSGIGLLAYLVAWIIIPEDPNCLIEGTKMKNEKSKTVSQNTKVSSKNVKNLDENVKFYLGLFLLGFGVIIILQNTLGIDLGKIIWPAILVVIGLLLINQGFDR